MASPIADFVVSLSSSGEVLSQGSLSKALASNAELSKEVVTESEALDETNYEVDAPKPDAPVENDKGKLIAEEEISMGTVGWPACMFMSCPW